jgi:predicted metalloprotease
MGQEAITQALHRVEQMAAEAKANPARGVNLNDPDHQLRVVVKALADTEAYYHAMYQHLGGQVQTPQQPPVPASQGLA